MRSSLIVIALMGVLASHATATTYHIGPGQKYVHIGDAPWSTLLPGDQVAIHYSATHYQEKILISQSGTAQNHIRVYGVKGPNGELPVIDGNQAVTAAQFTTHWVPLQDYGLLMFYGLPTQSWLYKVSYVDIDSLEFCNAYRGNNITPNTYTAADGTTRTYDWGAAGIYALSVDHLSILNCSVHDNGNGIFVSGNRDNTNILIKNCKIFGNSNVGRYREHNVYTEARGITFDGNYFGATRPGAQGCNLKDRSAGTVVKNNWFEGGQRELDLVDPQENAAAILPDPTYATTTVQSNVLVDENGMANKPVHFGGDSGITANYRPSLIFDHNTVLVQRDYKDSIGVSIFEAATNAQSITCSNNIIYSMSFTPGLAKSDVSWLLTYGTLTLSNNGANVPIDNVYLFRTLLGSISGTGTTTVADPLFVDVTNHKLQLQAASSFSGMGAIMSAVAAPSS